MASAKSEPSYSQLVQNATPEHMMAAFPDLEPLADRPSSSQSSSSRDGADGFAVDHSEESVLSGYDKEQIRLMNEACICVDYNDVPYAAGSKKTLHLMSSIRRGLLHRAFSVFLFNTKGELLLQQRATEKITFPDLWTNTCCSHPLAVTAEMGSDLSSASEGVKSAAVRKLEHELGITGIPESSFEFLTRIHYMAPSSGNWGEHEVDYILFVNADPVVNANPNEVRDFRWVSKSELQHMFEDSAYAFTPWFKLICENFLFKWWGNKPALDTNIHRML